MPEFIPVKTRSDAIKAAQAHLENQPSLSGGNLYELPDGNKLRVRKKEGGRLSAENYSTKEAADVKRTKEKRLFKTETERENVSQLKKEAKQQSESTEHQFVSSGKPTIVEHDVRLASGGSNEYVSLSDPYFKVFKDTVESKVYAAYGDKYVVDIDDVTGYVRVIPKNYHNKQQPTSQQPGFDFEPGVDIDQAVKKLPIVTAAEPPPQTSAPQGLAPKLPTTTRQTPTVLPKPKPAAKVKPPVKPTVTPKQNLSIPVMSAQQVRDAVGFNQSVQSAVTFGLQGINAAVRFGQAVGAVGAALFSMDGR